MPTYGNFINSVPTSLSDLKNNGFLLIREYVLNKETLSQNDSFVINDLNPGSTIVKISLDVKDPFTSDINNDAIEITTDSGSILFSKNINDMNVTSNYMTECYYTINEKVCQ